MIARTAADFVATGGRAETAATGSATTGDEARDLVARAGALGLLGADVPEADGGAGLDHAAAVVDCRGDRAREFLRHGLRRADRSSILPIVCFGTPAQRARYLPGLLSGEVIGAYCLSEAGSGSDALAARTRAVPQADGSWRLSGEKLWITNGGFADLFVDFRQGRWRSLHGVSRRARVRRTHARRRRTQDGPARLVDDARSCSRTSRCRPRTCSARSVRATRSRSTSSTTGDSSWRRRRAGRRRAALAEAAIYARTRQQFGQPIAAFGAIQQKLADMAVRGIRARKRALSHRGRSRRAERKSHSGRRARSVRHRSLAAEGPRQRDARFHRRRVRADPRRQRIRARLSGRTPVS